MATLSYNPKTRRAVVQFDPADGGRRVTLSVTDVTRDAAQTIRAHVTGIVAARRTGDDPPDETLKWLASVADSFYAKLAEKGLVSPRRPLPRDAFPVSVALDVPPCLHCHRAELAEFPLAYLATPVVYFLLNGGELVYIGKTTQIGKRLENHRLAGKLFNRVLVKRVSLEEMDTVESQLIRRHQPPLNKLPEWKRREFAAGGRR